MSKLVVSLSLAFGFLLLALVAELWYLLWRRRKRRTHTATEIHQGNDAKGMKLNGVCWKTPSTTTNNNNNSVSVNIDPENKDHEEPDLQLGTGKAFGEEGVEVELMRLHNLAGPPRFLFTINEETKEDLDSEDGKSRKGSRTRSLSDLMVSSIDTPFLNSSPLKSCLDNSVDSYNKHHHQGFNNPLFESELNNRYRSSPPPKFKFLRDAEEKLFRRLMEEAQRKAQMNYGSVVVPESKVIDSPNSTMVTDNKERQQEEFQQQLLPPQFPSSSSQVLPLASSPSTFRPIEKTPMVH